MAVRRLADQLAAGFLKQAEARYKRVAVLGFSETGAEARKRELGTVVSAELATALRRDHGFLLVERAKLKEVLGEMRLGAMGLVDEATAPRLGKLADAQALVLGSVSEAGDRFLVNARIVTAETAETVVASSQAVSAGSLVALSSEAVVLRSRSEALFRSMLLPGWGQFYNRQPAKGWIVAGGEAALVGGAVAAHVLGQAAESKYRKATDTATADAQRRRSESDYRWRNGLLIGAAGPLGAERRRRLALGRGRGQDGDGGAGRPGGGGRGGAAVLTPPPPTRPREVFADGVVAARTVAGSEEARSRPIPAGTPDAMRGGMTAPRQVLAGATYLVTRRCSERRFFLRPSSRFNAIFQYLLAVAATRYGVLIHAYCVMSNHYHLVLTDPQARLPDFQRYLDGLLARAANATLGRRQALWDRDSYSAVRLEDSATVFDKLLYVLLNPVTAGLVRRGAEWPGLWSAPALMGGSSVELSRPERFFRTKGPMPATATLTLQPPPGFEADEAFVERLLRAAQRGGGRDRSAASPGGAQVPDGEVCPRGEAELPPGDAGAAAAAQTAHRLP